MDGNIKTFKEKVCSNCKNKHCERGIYVTKYDNMIITKCCDYIKKDSKRGSIEEVIKYYHEKNKGKNKKEEIYYA